jgi:formylglycine-generating enzyme
MKTILLSLLLPLSLAAAPPVISNVTATQRAGTKLVDIRYDVADPDSASLTIQIELSANGGQTYELPVRSLTGAVGAGVAPGTSRLITWNAGADWNGNWSPNCKARLWAHDGSTPVPPLGMVYIPSGTFDMGSGPGVIGVPVTLTKSYFMDRTEVSAELWNEVRSWGLTSGLGYNDFNEGAFRAPGHPIHNVTWYDCVKWCNARSEKEGLTPCYYIEIAQTTVFRSGSPDITNALVKWTANGYRLPTEAEWERAARGGLYRKQFPWGDEIDGSQANFAGSGDPFESGAFPTSPCAYFNGSQLPAGVNMANGYGLYDMAGNCWEWSWDRYEGIPGALTDPKGPDTGLHRLQRGGSWFNAPSLLRCALRSGNSPLTINNDYGFRCVRGQ